MELSSDSISNLLQQEINDTNDTLHQFQFDEEEMEEYQKKRQIKKRAKQKLENLMNRKLYEMEKERLNEMEEINQPKDIYPILSKNGEVLEMYSTEQPQNVTHRKLEEPLALFMLDNSKELFHRIMTDDVLTDIINFTNERIDMEELISLDMKYYRQYCKVFNDVNKELTKYSIPDSYVEEEINLDKVKQMKSQLNNQYLIKYFDILINSPKQYILEKCFEMFHLERLRYFSNNIETSKLFSIFFEKIERFHQKKIEVRKISPITKDELIWFFGVIIYIGGRGYDNIEIAFKKDDILKYHTLSNRRYKEISRCLRFDSYEKRNIDDPLAPVSFLLEIVEKGIKLLYKPSNRFTIDKHIIPFTGAFKYSVTMKEKSHSKGIRMDCLNDCVTGYLYGFKIYSKSNETSFEMSLDDDHDDEEQNNHNDKIQFSVNVEQSQETQCFTKTEKQNEVINQIRKRGRPKKKSIEKSNKQKPNKITKYNNHYSISNRQISKTVKYLLKEFENNPQNNNETKRTIMIGMDNYFSTREVINYLVENDFGFCCTVRALRNYIPEKLKTLKLEEYESVQISKGNITLVNYKSKINKNVFLVSNMINQFKRNKQMNKKPEIVLLYNSLKGATDKYECLISNCDLRRKANRFQLAVLYDMLNMIVTDIYIIKKMSQKSLDHREFVVDLGLKLLNINDPVNPPPLCCQPIQPNVQCVMTDDFFIMRSKFPNGSKHVGRTNCLICNQCGKPIPTGTLKQLVFNFCEECNDKLQFPESFSFHSGRKRKERN